LAIKPTIYKLRIALSDLERNYYDTLNLTVALHPSETAERMMARVLAYCINAQEGLVFTKGLSEVEEPDMWVRTMDNKISLLIDVGEPSAERVKKFARKAETVKLYSFNSKSQVWWQQNESKLRLIDAEFYQIDHQQIVALATLLTRTMDMSVTITGSSAYVATGSGELEIMWKLLN